MAQARHWEQDKDATIYVGNLDERVNDALIWELFIQAGRIVNVHLPKDRVSQNHQSYGFVEFINETDATYAENLMNGIRLFGKPLRINKASSDKQKTVEVGAELFVGNLDTMVDERTLYETFSRFGALISPPKVNRDEHGLSKGYGFVSFADFDASDTAIANMNGQYLMNKEVVVQYAYKKDGKGERHGDEAERMLAAEGKKHNVQPQITPMPAQMPPQPVQMPTTPAMQSGASFGWNAPQGSAPPGVMANGYQTGPPQHSQPQRPPSAGPNTGANAIPLPPPPQGLPARPPPSQAGYGGPANLQSTQFNRAAPPPGLPAQQQQQQPYGAPAPGYGPPPGFGQAPGMMQGPPGMPPNMAPGYPPPQQQATLGRR